MSKGNQRISVRLDEDMLQTLENLCHVLMVDRSTVIRLAINGLWADYVANRPEGA